MAYPYPNAPPPNVHYPPEWRTVSVPPPHPNDSYRPPQQSGAAAPAPLYAQHAHQPPAPRQRTAIACRYCRRRKIRCSGFENTEDGRCGNCVRFNQDCIFTPVSAQTQAFVPAHTVWRGVGEPPPLYGAYGQPIPHQHPQAFQGPPPPPPPPGSQPYAHSPVAHPPAPYPPPPPAHPYPPHPPAAYDDRDRDLDAHGRKRRNDEPHAATAPPPMPNQPGRTSGPAYHYQEPPSVGPRGSAYGNAQPPPYYNPAPPRRPSPTNPPHAYPYSPSTASERRDTPGSGSNGSYYGGPAHPAPPPPAAAAQPQPAAPAPPRGEGSTPPPPSTHPSRGGMRINDLVSDSGPSRNPTDSSMLNRLGGRP